MSKVQEILDIWIQNYQRYQQTVMYKHYVAQTGLPLVTLRLLIGSKSFVLFSYVGMKEQNLSILDRNIGLSDLLKCQEILALSLEKSVVKREIMMFCILNRYSIQTRNDEIIQYFTN